ncbi:MAG: ankyrin repeat domain-containing protein [Sulfuritalea sp.]|nr:ankyrin repeat domain-containing protein [Sulfuritalea sp.]
MKTFSFFLAFLIGISSASAASLPDPVRFSFAIENGDIKQAREWLDAGLSPDFEGMPIGTGVMIGAWEGNVPMMELFAERGADINKTNAIGEQALLHAAWKGHLSAVRWLVEHGASLNRQGKQWAALHYAVFAGHIDVARYLLQQGADINALSTNGSTPLMMAAREGQESIAKELLAAGARADIVNEYGDDALRWAMRNNNLKIAREIAGRERFSEVVARPKATWGPEVRSQPVPDRADSLMAQARRMEASGRRTEARRLYRAAITAIRQAEALANKAAIKARAAQGMTITAKRSKPEAQSASLSYSTPAVKNDAKEDRDSEAAKIGAGDTATAGIVEDWLRRARELEAAGRRKEALHAYRQAVEVLRMPSPDPSSPPGLP